MAKLIRENKKKEQKNSYISEEITQYLVALWTGIICLFLPLYMKDGYHGIGSAKYEFYYNVTRFGIPFLLVLVVISFISKRREFSKSWLKCRVSALDGIVLAYLVLALVSFAFSQYKDAAWTGHTGWRMGLYSQLTFLFLYLVLSRFGKYGKGIIFVLCMAAAVAYTLGVLNRFLIDPLGMYEGVAIHDKLQFLSTLGQSSWYSAFVCTVLPMGLCVYLYAEKTWLRATSTIFCLVGFSTLVTQESDSAYIALACFMFLYMGIAISDVNLMKRFAELCLLFFVALKIMWLCSKVITDEMILRIDTVSRFLINSKLTWIALFLCIGLRFLLEWIDKKQYYKVNIMRMIRNIIYIAFGVLVVLSIVILILGANGFISESWMLKLENVPYLVWNDNWGNGRGFTWSATAEMYASMSPLQKLIGVGPECFPQYGYDYFQELLESKWGGFVLANAHNEWYTALINYGLLGALSYLGIFVAAVIRFLKTFLNSENKKELGILVGISACIVSYVGHNFFCYQTVICTPFIFMFIGIGEYYVRKNKGIVS